MRRENRSICINSFASPSSESDGNRRRDTQLCRPGLGNVLVMLKSRMGVAGSRNAMVRIFPRRSSIVCMKVPGH